jgi:hypothetical protein
VALTPEEIISLVEGDAVYVDVGVDLLDSNDVFVDDITADIVPAGSKVGYQRDGLIPFTGTMVVTRALEWGRQRVRPYMTLRSGDLEERWNLGVYLMSTPERVVGAVPQVFSVDLYDKTQVLNTSHGATVHIPKNGNYLAKAKALILAAGETAVLFDDSAVSAVAPNDEMWPLDESTTTLDIVDEILSRVNYTPVWNDRQGVYRAGPKVLPTNMPSSWHYDTSSDRTSVAEYRTETLDLFNTPNEWIFVRDDPGQNLPTQDSGRTIIQNPDYGPSSIVGRGGQIVRRVIMSDAADDSLFEDFARSTAAEQMQPGHTVKIETSANPTHWANEAVLFTDPGLPVDPDLVHTGRYQVDAWDLPWDTGMMPVTLSEIPPALPEYRPGGGSFTGGTTVDIGDYRVHTFLTSGTLTMVAPGTVQVLVVGGGGGGGSNATTSTYGSGGGGGGQTRWALLDVAASQTVTVGAGGLGGTAANTRGLPGSPSSFGALLSALGGGGGGASAAGQGEGADGGSGGGSAGSNTVTPYAVGLGTAPGGNAGGQGHAAVGGNHGGGGGGGAAAAGAAGTSSAGGAGGAGALNSYSGFSVAYGGGGGGGVPGSVSGGVGGVGGGGDGSNSGTVTAAAENGDANTGGGGGGGRGTNVDGGNGGSGIVVVRYLIP